MLSHHTPARTAQSQNSWVPVLAIVSSQCNWSRREPNHEWGWEIVCDFLIAVVLFRLFFKLQSVACDDLCPTFNKKCNVEFPIAFHKRNAKKSRPNFAKPQNHCAEIFPVGERKKEAFNNAMPCNPAPMDVTMHCVPVARVCIVLLHVPELLVLMPHLERKAVSVALTHLQILAAVTLVRLIKHCASRDHCSHLLSLWFKPFCNFANSRQSANRNVLCCQNLSMRSLTKSFRHRWISARIKDFLWVLILVWMNAWSCKCSVEQQGSQYEISQWSVAFYCGFVHSQLWPTEIKTFVFSAVSKLFLLRVPRSSNV